MARELFKGGRDLWDFLTQWDTERRQKNREDLGGSWMRDPLQPIDMSTLPQPRVSQIDMSTLPQPRVSQIDMSTLAQKLPFRNGPPSQTPPISPHEDQKSQVGAKQPVEGSVTPAQEQAARNKAMLDNFLGQSASQQPGFDPSAGEAPSPVDALLQKLESERTQRKLTPQETIAALGAINRADPRSIAGSINDMAQPLLRKLGPIGSGISKGVDLLEQVGDAARGAAERGVLGGVAPNFQTGVQRAAERRIAQAQAQAANELRRAQAEYYGSPDSRNANVPMSVKEYEYFQNLGTEEQADFLSLQRGLGLKYVPGVGYVDNYGRTFANAEDVVTGKVAEETTITEAAGEAGRRQAAINRGWDAVEALPVLYRNLDLLERVKTGGYEAIKLEAKQTLGIESADEGELTQSLGIAVLSQLRQTFGAAFTEEEGKRLERLSAGITRNNASNMRILRSSIRMVERVVKRSIKNARDANDHYTANELQMELDRAKDFLNPDIDEDNVITITPEDLE